MNASSKKVVCSIVVAVSVLFPSIAKADWYIYNSIDPGKQPNANGYYRTFAPYMWYQASTRNPITWTNVSMPGSDQIVIDSFNNWFNLSGTPSWMAQSKNTSSYVIRFTKNNVCVQGAVACIEYSNETTDFVRRTSTFNKFTINYPFYDNHTEAQRRQTITHELGHVLGLGDVDCSGPINSTIMTTMGCAFATSIPSTWDNTNVLNYWKACNGSQSWCGTMHPYNSPSLTWDTGLNRPYSKWENHSWLNYSSVMYYYESDDVLGPYTLKYQKNTYYNGIGYWEDAVLGSHYVSEDWGHYSYNWTSGKWIVVCNQAWIWYNIMGYWTCSSNAVQVP